MNVRGAPGVGVIDDLVDKLHDGAVRFGDNLACFLIAVIRVGVHLSEDVGDRGFFLWGLKEVVDKIGDVFSEGDIVPYGLGLHEVFDHVPLEDVIGVVHELADGHP